MRRGIIQIVLFFHFKSLGLLAMSLDNGNAGVVWCQLSKWMEQLILVMTWHIQHYAALSRTSLTLDTSSPHKCCLMPPQILIQDVEQFQALQNLGEYWWYQKVVHQFVLHCLRKKDHVKTTHFWATKLHGWWHCDKHNYGCTRYASRCC